MVTVVRNGKEFTVTAGAAKILATQGYTIEQPVKSSEADVHEEVSVDQKFLDEVVTKPIAQWSKAEVKRYTDLTGLDTSGAKTVADVKEMIKRHLQ